VLWNSLLVAPTGVVLDGYPMMLWKQTLSLTHDSGDGFSGTISYAILAPGQYCIGILANSPNDPGFAVNGTAPISDATLRALAATPGEEITYTAATPGSGPRIAFNQ
jgi:hypothetical protein